MGLTNDPQEARESGIDPITGMQNKYVVLTEAERAKGFVRPLRYTYIHEPRLGGCGVATTMNEAIAETYARDPFFYGGTYCAGCHAHFPVGVHGQFVWDKPKADTPLGEQWKVGT